MSRSAMYSEELARIVKDHLPLGTKQRLGGGGGALEPESGDDAA